MSEAAGSKDEFYTAAKSMLTSLGASNPTVGESGSIPVSGNRNSLVESLNMVESTRAGQKILNQFPRPQSDRVISSQYDRPICNVLGCGIISALPIECSKTEIKWEDPEIDIVDIPIEIPNATAHLNPFNARIEGNLGIQGKNKSEPGEKITQKTFKCKNQIEESSKEKVEGSAVVSMAADHSLTDVNINESIARVQSSFRDVAPQTSTETQVSFEKSGPIETLEGILDIWTTGITRVDIVGTVTTEYEWRNSVKSRSYDIDATARIPVRNLDYSW